MKILFLSGRLPYANVAGGHHLVYQRMVRLARRGHQVGLASFCAPADRQHENALREQLADVTLLPPPAHRVARQCASFFFSSVPFWYARLRDPAMARLVGELVETRRYDVVLAEFSNMGQYLFRNPWLPAVRTVISCHHSSTMVLRSALEVLGPTACAFQDWLRMKGLRGYEFDMYRAVDAVTVLTPEERLRLLDFEPRLRIAVVPGGVNAAYFAPPENAVRENRLLFTGYYSDEPNRDAVLWFTRTAWPELRRRHPDLQFYIVGPEPPDAVCDLARRDKRIVVTGMVDDIRPYLHGARVFLCPVRMGTGMRGKILEAMAAGAPVVSTTLGVAGIPAQTGDNCFLADRPDLMVRQISLLLNDEPLRRTLADNARRMVTERFDWDRGIDLLEQTLVSVLNG